MATLLAGSALIESFWGSAGAAGTRCEWKFSQTKDSPSTYHSRGGLLRIRGSGNYNPNISLELWLYFLWRSLLRPQPAYPIVTGEMVGVHGLISGVVHYFLEMGLQAGEAAGLKPLRSFAGHPHSGSAWIPIHRQPIRKPRQRINPFPLTGGRFRDCLLACRGSSKRNSLYSRTRRSNDALHSATVGEMLQSEGRNGGCLSEDPYAR